MPWTWRRKKKEDSKEITPTDEKDPKPPKKPKEEKIKLYPARNMALVTTESNLELVPCKVFNDHTVSLKYSGGKKEKIKIKDDRPAHTLTIPCTQIWPTFLGRRFSPRFQRYRVYTIQAEGEVTHDPHLDHMDEKQKMRFEKLIQLQAVAGNADIAGNIMAGLKDKKGFWEMLPWIIMAIVVFLFLFAFQIQPNL